MSTTYRDLRKEHGLSRREVCDYVCENGLGYITEERLERIENEKFPITPDEVLLLAEVYRTPSLWNYYCSQKCPIGKKHIKPIKTKELTQIVLETLSSLNTLRERQERLIEISADGTISDEELKDFIYIKEELSKISMSVQTLQDWVDRMLQDGKIDIEKYNELNK